MMVSKSERVERDLALVTPDGKLIETLIRQPNAGASHRARKAIAIPTGQSHIFEVGMIRRSFTSAPMSAPAPQMCSLSNRPLI